MRQFLKRGSFTIFLLALFELGGFILIPGFQLKNYAGALDQNAYINLISSNFGSQITVPSLFALGLGPYMTALIVWQVITTVDDKTTSRMSQKVSGYWQKGITFVLAALQALAMSKLFLRYRPKTLGFDDETFFWFIFTVLLAGAMLIVWLADVNKDLGVGGVSIFIIPGLVKNLPTVLDSGLKKPLNFSIIGWIIVAIIVILFVYITVFVNEGEYRIPVERIGVNSFLTDSYIPIKVLVSGAMPFMFALSLFSIPLLVVSNLNVNAKLSKIISLLFSYHTWQGIVSYGLIIIVLSYLFAFVNFQPNIIAKSLKESGDYIFNLAPGKETEKYLTGQVNIMSFVGTIYILLIALAPLVVGLYFPIVTNFSFLFGSLFILITILDGISQEILALIYKYRYRIF
ncbi:preprotein translocase subunit SecY [Fructilactobacillus fructivorans]|uniref:Accessory Sec system protein translocase subunit SecY2 n=1 Tax=Fructilactobacillus fructivorans TaxID=1614 RepID=A0AAE6TX52_9LACO|nr:preprotein translocase subunit SecY [Fructilactobacillus fructivorans]KRK58034.1 preprotein translocase subunit SecY [Fructilactobacillus fructivorans]KRN13149.1 preprotein translocase subunit SecY [Fructilactobacillus fructivorans]QFX93267.1 accessory Sec system protein translocase subunit SecY2 [Fructilactobacillus fructivorans]RDV65088.1 accessory Sec system protein translocase subunit SecY2 [Fructilactobacillus fructivorans]